MGIFSAFKSSWKKSGDIKSLQKEIANLTFEPEKEKVLMDQYLNICESDEGVVDVMRKYNLTRDDLYQYYIQLSGAGLGEWVKGHYVPLSTITYFEPLLFMVEAKKREVGWGTIVDKILGYWEGDYSNGKLLQILENESPFLNKFKQ